jgi:hypothetical protein
MKRSIGFLVVLLVLAGYSLIATGQTTGDEIFCSGFESGDDGSCLSATTLSEGFDDIGTLAANGWILVNHSAPVGSSNWFQGSTEVFPSQTGADDAYIAANYNNTTDTGTISNWLITPLLTFGPDTKLSFWTRVKDNPALFADRLEIRLCVGATCTNVGSSSSDVKDFATLLASINPSLTPTGYPATWTEYTFDASNGLPTSGHGRIAFRYYVTNAGQGGANGNYIGIDSVSIN